MKVLQVAVLLFVLFAPVCQGSRQYKAKLGQAFCSLDPREPNEEVTLSDSDPAIEGLIKRVLDTSGLPQNFTVKAYNKFNAEARIDEEDGQKKRYILYNKSFLEQIQKATSSEWGIIGILAHEIAHHLLGHTAVLTGSNRTVELEADNWAGFVMGKMGATLEQAKCGIDAISANVAVPGSSHPIRRDRLAEVDKGWKKATNTDDATLRLIQIRFALPKGDNKDFDTRVSITIERGNTIIAKNEDIAPGQEFRDPGDYGPFGLALVAASTTKAEYKSSQTVILIRPNGHDTWITNVIIEASFSDGKTIRSESGLITLSQNSRTAHFTN